MLGIGLPLALLIQVLYFQRLLLFNSPPRDVIISVFLPLGPCGQGGYACLHLGRVALQLFPLISTPASSSGVPQLFSVGQALYGAGLISAMMLFGLGMWWLVIGVCTIIRELSHGKLGFNMGWWGLTFPSASLAICTASLAVELDSLALKITYTALVIANIALWTYVAIPTVRGAWTGRLCSARHVWRICRSSRSVSYEVLRLVCYSLFFAIGVIVSQWSMVSSSETRRPNSGKTRAESETRVGCVVRRAETAGARARRTSCKLQHHAR